MQTPKKMLTQRALEKQFRKVGMRAGHTVLMHTSLKAIKAWIPGGTQTIIAALLAVLGKNGTLMMPAHTPDNTDPSRWMLPPVPQKWWPIIRQESAPFDLARTPCHEMGALAEYFRTYPGVIRSNHPIVSFCATGKHARALTDDHDLNDFLGERSPIGRLYALDGYVLLLGVDHNRNTSLHLAEHRAAWPGKAWLHEGSAMLADGQRQWITYDILDVDTDDFPKLGAAYQESIGYTPAHVGDAEACYLRQRPMVDFGTTWFSTHRR